MLHTSKGRHLEELRIMTEVEPALEVVSFAWFHWGCHQECPRKGLQDWTSCWHGAKGSHLDARHGYLDILLDPFELATTKWTSRWSTEWPNSKPFKIEGLTHDTKSHLPHREFLPTWWAATPAVEGPGLQSAWRTIGMRWKVDWSPRSISIMSGHGA